MSDPLPADRYTVRVAQEAEWHAALSLALAPLAASARGPLIDQVRSLGAEPIAPLEALVVASEGQHVAAACWAQPSAGRVAVSWPPRWSGARPADAQATERAMLAATSEIADAAGLSLCQLMTEDESDPVLPAAVSAGFHRVATLRYVACRTPRREPPSQTVLTFTRSDRLPPNRFGALVESTYAGSLDCPRLDGLRRIEDTLTGYRGIGRHDPAHWLVAHDAETEQEVGVLLLSEHPASSQLELVYVGVTPAARGRGYGDAMLAQTARVAHSLGVDETVAAVDEANTPALAMYDRAGFRGWTRRHVFVRPLGGWDSTDD